MLAVEIPQRLNLLLLIMAVIVLNFFYVGLEASHNHLVSDASCKHGVEEHADKNREKNNRKPEIVYGDRLVEKKQYVEKRLLDKRVINSFHDIVRISDKGLGRAEKLVFDL